MEKTIDQMNAAELRAALNAYHRSQNPVTTAPLPPGITAEMPPKAQETASQLYGEALLRKSAGSLTPDEKTFLRGSIGAALRDLGY